MGQREAVRLDRDAWVTAALEALREGGLAALSVEPLAARLGATKGSFYWHFRDRDALVVAALEQWEHEATAEVIADVEQTGDAHQRLERLFDLAYRRPGPGRVELALLADAGHPLVRAVLARVTRRRIDYLTELFTAAGHDAPTACHRAVLAYSAHIGLIQAQRVLGGRLFPSAAERNRYVEFLLPALA